VKRIFLGLLRFHILFHADKDSVYGAELMQKMKKHGVSISPGTIYPILHDMEREGLLKSYKSVVNGKVRRYYKLTPKGKRTLRDTGYKVRELVEGVFKINFPMGKS